MPTLRTLAEVPRRARLALLIACAAAGCVDAPTAPAPGAGSVAHSTATTQLAYSTTWAEYPLNAVPTGWSSVWDPSPPFAVAAGESAGDAVLRWSATTVSRNRFGFAYDGFGEVGDQEVLTEVRVRSLGGGTSAYYMGTAAVRMSGSATDERGYGVHLVVVPSTGAKAAVLNTWVDGAYTQLRSTSLDWALDTWYSVRLQATGTQIRGKIWPRGTVEPAAWTVEATDARYATGRPGVLQHDMGTVEWDAWSATVQTSATVTGVRISPDQGSLSAGDTLRFAATLRLSDGGTAPVSASFAATGGTITPAGLYTAGASPGVYAVIATHPASGLADTAAVTIGGASGFLSWSTHFAVDALDSAPAGWTETSAPTASSWSVVAADGALDGRMLRNVTTATARHILRLDAAPDTSTAQEILVRMRMGDADARGPGVALRHRMENGRESAFVAYLRPDANQVEINRFLQGGWLFVASRSFVNDPGAWYWLRFRAQGSALSLRVWADGAPEPAEWTLQAVNDGIASGGVGLYTYEPNTVDYDLVGAATAGATAPVPGAAPPPPPPTLAAIELLPAAATVVAGATRQFSVSGRLSDGTTIPVTATYVAGGGGITSGGLYTAGAQPGVYEVIATHAASGFADTAIVTVQSPPPPPAPTGSAWFTDFSTGTVGSPMPDLMKLRSSWEWNYLLAVRDDAQAGRVLRMEGSGTVNGASRPHAWLLVPRADQQEVVVKLRTTSTAYTAGGAFVGGSIDALNRGQEYGARLSKGRFQIWNWRNGAFNMLDVAATSWVPNQWMWVRLRKTATRVMAKYWVDGQPEPSAWTLDAPREFGFNGGSTPIPSGYAGIYANSVQSGVEFGALGAAIDGGTAPISGTPAVGALPAPALAGAVTSSDFAADPIGQTPAGWTPAYVTTGVTWKVESVGGDPALRSVGTGSGHRLLVNDAVSTASADQEVLLRVRPSATGSSYTVGAALRVEGAAGGSNSFYAVTLGPQSINVLRVVNGSAAALETSSIKFDYQAGRWYWMRARVQGTTIMSRVWRTDEPEPGSWFKWTTDSSLSAGTAGIYHMTGDTAEIDDVSIRPN